MASKVYDSSANGLQNARWSCSPFMTLLKRFLNHSAPGLADIFPSKHPCHGSGKPLSPFTREAPTCLPASVRLAETEYLAASMGFGLRRYGARHSQPEPAYPLSQDYIRKTEGTKTPN